MSERVRFIDQSRAGFDDRLTTADLAALSRMPQLKTLQADGPVDRRVWKLIDREFSAQRPDVALRIYGHYGTECDLSFCSDLLHVRHFLADCLMQARNVEAIGEIPRLETLSLGIHGLETLDVLDRIPDSVTSLNIGGTRSRKPDVRSLARFQALSHLYLEGHTKGIDAIGTLARLERLTLRSITTNDVEYLQPLGKLRSLDIKLGGIRSLDAIDGKAGIRHLELWQIRGFSDPGIVSRLPDLQNVFLQSLRQVTSLPDLEGARELRRMIVQNMGGLQDLRSLGSAPALEDFLLLEGSKQQPEQLVPLLENQAVRMAGAFFGSDARNERFDTLRTQYGKLAWEWHEFAYR